MVQISRRRLCPLFSLGAPGQTRPFFLRCPSLCIFLPLLNLWIYDPFKQPADLAILPGSLALPSLATEDARMAAAAIFSPAVESSFVSLSIAHSAAGGVKSWYGSA